MNAFLKKMFVRHTISFVCVCSPVRDIAVTLVEMGGEDLGGALVKKKKNYTCKLRYSLHFKGLWFN